MLEQAESIAEKIFCVTCPNRTVTLRQLKESYPETAQRYYTAAENVLSILNDKVAREILDKFNQWADDSINDYRDIPFPNNSVRAAKENALISAKQNLIRIISEVTGIEGEK